MSKNSRPTAENKFPTDDMLAEFIRAQGSQVSKNTIAKHFSIHGMEQRRALKEALKRLVKDGKLNKEKGRNYSTPQSVPLMTTLVITGVDSDLRAVGTPEKDIDGLKEKAIPCLPAKKGDIEKLQRGDRVLAHLEQKQDKWVAVPVRKLGENATEIVGVAQWVKDSSGHNVAGKNGVQIIPTDRRNKEMYFIPEKMAQDIKHGDLVKIRPEEKRQNKNIAQLIEILGPSDDPRNFSLIAIHENAIRYQFSEKCLIDAERYSIPPLGKRKDYRKTPLVTIDGEDARDFDDAVFVQPHPTKKNHWHVTVAIADVAYYVRPDSPLDKEARLRGNSVYFPDRVVPMLPEALSNDMCSLRPDEDRACMVAEMTITPDGELIHKGVHRGLMRSKARLTYTIVEKFILGQQDALQPDLHEHIQNLYKAYKIMRAAREKRGALDIRSNEQKVIFDDDHHLKAVQPRERYTSHQIIEEMMILANVAVAELLDEKKSPTMYRAHDKPSLARLDITRSFLAGLGYKVPFKNDVTPFELNQVLQQANDRPEEPIVHETILRAQSTAIYHPDTGGHFGLGLESYVHFTSPIRRYADLLIHRALINVFELGEGGLQKGDETEFHVIAEHISSTERTAAKAERETLARYTAAYLQEKQGVVFQAQISGVNDFGVFVRLSELGAEGIIPIRMLPRDYYIYDEKTQALIGRHEGRIYRLLSPIMVRLLEVEPLKGSLLFETADDLGANLTGFQESKERRTFQHKENKKRKRQDMNKGKDKGFGKKSGNKRRR